MSEPSASSLSARLCTCETAFCPALRVMYCMPPRLTACYLAQEGAYRCCCNAHQTQRLPDAGIKQLLHESALHNNCAINVHDHCTHCPSPLNAPEVYLCMTPWLLGCRRQSAFWSWLQYLQTSAQGHLHASQIHAQMSRCWQR